MKFKTLLKMVTALMSTASVTAMASITAFAEGDAATATASAGGSMTGMLISMGLVLVVMYFLLIRPQKKKEKETKSMQDTVQVGDEIVTYGGIVGIVVRRGEDNVVIETGGEKNKIRVKTWAISENTTAKEKMVAEEKAMKKARMTPAKEKDDSAEN